MFRCTRAFLVVAIAAGALVACGSPVQPDASQNDGGDVNTGDMVTPPDTPMPTDTPTPADAPTDTPPPTDVPVGCADPMIPALTTASISGTSTFAYPVYAAQAPGSTNTIWVVEKTGRIRLVRGGMILATPFLDISSRLPTLSTNDERGLLGLAFHPDYASNGRFFIYYTPAAPFANVVAEYRRSASNPDVADPMEVRRLVSIPDSEPNHNGGMLAFGRDGRLYVGTGDGGGGGDRHGAIGNGLSLTTLFGKILRLDVDNTAGNFAAAGNPFSGAMGLPQIWAYGIRNAWRFSFDRMTGDLYIGDVGQNAWEEINVQPSGATGGANYGWRAFEGNAVFDSALSTQPVASNHARPVVVYPHAASGMFPYSGCSVTGGYVYRGAAIAALQGVYLFGDYCSRDLAAFRYCSGMARGYQRISGVPGAGCGLASFGEDNAGELYLVCQGMGANTGRVLRLQSM